MMKRKGVTSGKIEPAEGGAGGGGTEGAVEGGNTIGEDENTEGKPASWQISELASEQVASG
jgi:hypothetical protein